MNTQNENAHYDHQSFDQYPTSPMYPAAWDLSALLSAPKTEPVSDTESSADGDAS